MVFSMFRGDDDNIAELDRISQTEPAVPFAEIKGEAPEKRQERLNESLWQAAVLDDDAGETKRLVRLGADPHATRHGQGNVVSYVLRQLGDELPKKYSMFNALCELSMEKKVDFNRPDQAGRMPLFLAAKELKHTVLADMIKAGADPYALNKDNENLATWSVGNYKKDWNAFNSLQLLAEMKPPLINFNKMDGNGDGAVHIAAKNGYSDVIGALGSVGADMNQKKKEGDWTPFKIALVNDHPDDVLKMLIRYGADPTIGGSPEGGVLSPFSTLARQGRYSVIEEIELGQIDIKKIDEGREEMMTALMWAAKEGGLRIGLSNCSSKLIPHKSR